MEIVGVLLIFLLVFAAILFVPLRIAWMRFRLIAVSIPAGSDPQAFRYKLIEAIRSFGYRAAVEAAASAQFSAPAWLKWAVGLQDISVSPAAGGVVLVTGPAMHVSPIGKTFAGAARQPYDGPQPVWPLVKGILKIFAIGLVVTGASIGAAVVFGR